MIEAGDVSVPVRVGHPAVVLMIALVLPVTAAAQETDLSRCLAIGNIEERVRCYDLIAEAQVQRAMTNSAGETSAASIPPVSSPAPVAPTATASAAAASAPAVATPTFGLSAAQREARRDPAAREADQLAANVVSARSVGPGYWRFELSDGTVWQLTETRRSFRAPRPGDSIVIRRGALGAFYLDADRQPVIGIRRVD
ncbi:hypothetical protein [Altererythrobacter lauratis]|uniref:Uncharacterized protein n=1 Tax=Alteraurantiacibacter lauratis TaxID=2054627 RepID=A0ABV7EHI5_9SPHN